eukprot:GHVO01017678.1.p1 GENE.GHVO01017678.1~~GHVO01017678.1.p1  ORF type:complete len:278 (-),score=37.26 GHVO01017678.1:96-896(-)
MADKRQGFGRGFSRGRGDRGRGRGNRDSEETKAWVPLTKLGRLVKEGKITSLEEIYLHSLPIKEFQIVDFIYNLKVATGGDQAIGADEPIKLIDEVMKVMPVQKQTRAGQRTRFKAFVAVGDKNGFVGLGVKCAKEVATAIRGAIISAKLSLIPVRRGYWGNKIGRPHTVPMKVSGKCGSVRVRLIPAPRGAMVVGAPTTKKMLQFAGIKDCYTSSTGSTRTRGNFMKALFQAMGQTYSYLTPDLWAVQPLTQPPFEEHSASLVVA